jgi:hypothetical protein
MSMATRAKSAKARASIAIRMIKTQTNFYRAFNDCFEMNDGEEVVTIIAQRANADKELAACLLRKQPLGLDILQSRGFNLQRYA